MAMRDIARTLIGQAHTLNSAVLEGITGRRVEVQAQAIESLSNPKPWTSAVELSGIKADEGRQMIRRLSGALSSLGYPESYTRIVLNFHPAELPKRTASLEMPATLALLQAAGYLGPMFNSGDFVFCGSVDAHGAIRHTPGILSLAGTVRTGQTFIVPEDDSPTASLARQKTSMEIVGAENLSELLEALKSGMPLSQVLTEPQTARPDTASHRDINDVIGQEQAKFAAAICAAGGHGLFLIGPPGTGKTMLASRIPSLLPPLTDAERYQVESIYSAAEMDPIHVRPFRAVHHSASKESLIGGGTRNLQIGEVTLSHLGVLFLDELTEFNRATLDALRQPMQDGTVRVSRVNHKITLPARFRLVAAANPCPCGHFPSKRCQCKQETVRKYQGKMSGAVMDRIDLVCEMNRENTRLFRTEASRDWKTAVSEAVRRQQIRLGNVDDNASIPPPHLKRLCRANLRAVEMLEQEVEHKHWSMRKAHQALKVSRTIADLDGADEIGPQHVEQAMLFIR